MYIAKELWHGRSARDQSIKDVGRGMWRSINDLMLVRYACSWTSNILEQENSLIFLVKIIMERSTNFLKDAYKNNSMNLLYN